MALNSPDEYNLQLHLIFSDSEIIEIYSFLTRMYLFYTYISHVPTVQLWGIQDEQIMIPQ